MKNNLKKKEVIQNFWQQNSQHTDVRDQDARSSL